MAQNVVGKKIVTLCGEKNIPLAELPERSGLAAEQLDKIINSERIPSLGSLIKVARALGVRVGTFLDDSHELGPAIHRCDEAQQAATFSSQLSEANSNLDYFALASQKAGRSMEPFIIDIKPTGAQHPILSSHEGEEFIYVLDGAIKVHYGKDEHILQAGDSIYYDSIVDHLVETLNGTPARILAVVYTPF